MPSLDASSTGEKNIGWEKVKYRKTDINQMKQINIVFAYLGKSESAFRATKF